MAKKPNFIDNIWAKSKSKIIAATEKLGNFAGGFVGLSSAGTIAANLMEKIPIKKMADKALASGKVDTQKVAETLASNGIEPTKANIKVVTDVVSSEAATQAADPTNGKPNKAPTVDPKALGLKDKLMTYAKQYWYVGLIVVAGVVYLIFKPKTNKKR